MDGSSSDTMISVLFLVVVIMVMVGVAMMLGSPPRTWQHALPADRPTRAARTNCFDEAGLTAQE